MASFNRINVLLKVLNKCARSIQVISKTETNSSFSQHRFICVEILGRNRQFCTASDEAPEVGAGNNKKKDVDPSKDRRIPVPLEKSLKYMESQAYKETYGPTNPVWKHYRRNFKGSIPPRKTREKCIRGGIISTGNPCPICRDEYLVVDYQNIKLLKQFISPFTGEVYDSFVTGVCRAKHMELLVAIEKAKDSGYLTYEVPFRQYNYLEYYDPKSEKKG